MDDHSVILLLGKRKWQTCGHWTSLQKQKTVPSFAVHICFADFSMPSLHPSRTSVAEIEALAAIYCIYLVLDCSVVSCISTRHVEINLLSDEPHRISATHVRQCLAVLTAFQHLPKSTSRSCTYESRTLLPFNDIPYPVPSPQVLHSSVSLNSTIRYPQLTI